MKNLGILAILMISCADGYYQAPYYASLSMCDDITLGASTAFIDQDGTGMIVLADVMVVDSINEVPMDNIQVEVITGWPGVYVVPETAVKLVDYPSPGEGVSSVDEVTEACDADGDGRIDADAGEWCSWWWESGVYYYQFGSDYADTSSKYRPTYLIDGTDEHGILRFYLFIDSMPYSSSDTEVTSSSSVDWSDVPIWVSIGVEANTFNVKISSGTEG